MRTNGCVAGVESSTGERLMMFESSYNATTATSSLSDLVIKFAADFVDFSVAIVPLPMAHRWT
jgi:hypothetical protein